MLTGKNKLLASCFVSGVLMCTLFLALSNRASAFQEPSKSGSLKVTVEYKGAGTVDKSHKIWVWIFDTPAIDGSSMPIASDALIENKAASTFQGLPTTVYIAVSFDEKGGFDGTSGPPPSGSPVMIYGEAGTAKPVKTGPDATVTVSFDDSVRMP